MASTFLYFFPRLLILGNSKHIPPECNLQTVLDGCDFSAFRTNQGPDGREGMVAVMEPAPQSGGIQAKIIFDLDKQTWMPVSNEEKKITHWIGWETENPPGCRELVRPMMTEGLPLRLNGQPYMIPLATLAELDTTINSLPNRYHWENGGVVEVVKDRYASLVLRCKKQFDWVRKQAGFEDVGLEELIMGRYEQFFLACDLLNVNYRVSAPEVCALDLLDCVSVLYVIKYALGEPYITAQWKAQDQKKSTTHSDM